MVAPAGRFGGNSPPADRHRGQPDVHGLPEENQNVENLFDVQIPSLQIRRPWEFQRTIEDLVQMKFKRPPRFNPPPGYFPKSFTNTTPAELLEEFGNVAMTNRPHRFKVDPEANTIEFQGPIWEQIKQRLDKLFGR